MKFDLVQKDFVNSSPRLKKENQIQSKENSQKRNIQKLELLKSLKNISEIKDIECPIIDYNIFNSLAYGQWTLKEMESGEAWETISKNKS